MLKLHNWCSSNKLKINPIECAAIIIPDKLHDVELDINILYNNQNIACYNNSKYLGVIIDNNLNFKTHIQNVENKVSRSVGILSKLRFLFPPSTFLQLYYAFVHPYLLYGLLLWGCTFPLYLSKLQSLQNKAFCIISNSKFKAPLTPQFEKLAILKIINLYNLELGKIMHQHSGLILTPCFNTLFNTVSAIHNRFTRSIAKNNLYVPKYSTSRCQKSIKYQGPTLWNSLLIKLKNLPFNKFKSNYKKKLLENYS